MLTRQHQTDQDHQQRDADHDRDNEHQPFHGVSSMGANLEENALLTGRSQHLQSSRGRLPCRRRDMSTKELIDGAVEHLRTSASVKTVYGTPITSDGKTIIPVAKVAYGFGVGRDRKSVV